MFSEMLFRFRRRISIKLKPFILKIKYLDMTSFLSKKVNIAIQLDGFDKGGLEEVVYSLINSISRDKSINLYLFVNDDKLGYLGRQSKKEGVKIILLKNDKEFLIELIRQLKIRLVNLHYSTFGIEEYIDNHVSTIYTVHNSYIWADEHFVEQRAKAYRKIQKFIAVSDQARDFFIQRFGVEKEKVVTIPNGLDLIHLNKVQKTSRNAINLQPEDFVFINVSSFNWYKFHILMVAAMQQLVMKFPNIKMLFVGNVADSSCYNYIRKEIEINGLSNNIHIIDYVPKEKVLGLLKLSDCFILPSLIEGWSMALMEAMYMELPLIVSDIGSARHVIVDNDIGIIIPNPYIDINTVAPDYIIHNFTNRNNLNNIASICDAMIDIYTNSQNWKQKAKNGKLKIIEKYNSFQMTETYLSTFKSML